MNAALEDFVELVLKNLHKNGFPQTQVSFPLEKMYEEADKRGFSFNKVRDILKSKDIITELTDTKVVFKAVTVNNDSQNNEQDMFAKAQEMLNKMSPAERDNIMNMVKNMDGGTIENMKQQWGKMSSKEKEDAMKNMDNFK